MRTHEGAKAYEHSLNHALEFFSKAGSLFSRRDAFYGEEESALSLFQKTWIVDKELSMRLLLWLRDCRGGAGNRSGARDCYRWLAQNDPVWLSANLHWLPAIGRWDDLRSLFRTDLEREAALMWLEAIRSGDVLAAKWADRKDSPLRKPLKLSIGDFRRHLAKIRSPHIVEHKMCHDQWSEIEYPKVPSVAMSRYTKAFGKHDEERFNEFKDDLKSGKVEIHAGQLFPHDCVRTSRYGDRDIADEQFAALPNYLEGVDERIIVVCDTSGSMGQNIAKNSSVEAVHVSIGMSLYCSDKIGSDNPFYRKFIAFCSEGSFKSWEGMGFSQALRDRSIFNGAVGATRIDKSLDLILRTAKYFNITQEQMPTTLLIISDMQFHSSGGRYSSYGFGTGVKGKATEVNKCMQRWVEAGYEVPKIVYWNTAGYAGNQATANDFNTGLVSGYSPAILKSLFSGDDFSPVGIMMRALEKYEAVCVPK